MSQVFQGRYTAETNRDFVVFIIGMGANSFFRLFPHTVLILQIIADELDRRSVAKGQLKSDEAAKESVRLNKQSNKFALWALIIAGLSLASSLLIPFLIKSSFP